MIKENTQFTLAEVARRLNDAEITWAVFAGAAASIYGSSRPLTDVDILVPAAEGKEVAELFPEGNTKRHEGKIFGVELPNFDIIAGLSLDTDLDTPMMTRIQHHKLQGVTVPVIPPEDNILLKAAWGRGSEVGKHDWEDVQAMLTHLPTLDWEYLRWRATTCIAEPQRKQILARLQALWEQKDR
jgi:hypothetical protein